MTRPRRRLLLVAMLVVAATTPSGLPSAAGASCPPPGGASIAEAAAPTHRYDVLFLGRGLGHSSGMSQYGARGAALLGCTYRQILDAYYPATHVARAAMPRAVLLRMLDNGGQGLVTAEAASVAWQRASPASTLTQPRGQTWSVTWRSGTATLRDSTGAPRLTARSGAQLRARHSGQPIRLRTYSRSGALVLDRRLRWDYARFTPSTSGLQVRQVIENTTAGSGMNKYLWGLDEMLLSWPAETFKAQIVAARTFAARRGAGGDPVLSPTSADQNYTGAVHEDADARAGRRWRNAVNATTGQVVVADGSNALIDALYTSSHGGRSEDKQFVWGGTAVSYLKAIDDSRWDQASGNPASQRTWAAGLTWRQVATALGVDSVTGMSVANRGSSGRNLGVRVTGVDGGAAFDRRYRGWDIRQALRAHGVKSPGFTIVR